eukprot:XP_014776165.1 PREDICTED: rho GTPase-activating protein gacII-like [Octopus bimaculoides]
MSAYYYPHLTHTGMSLPSSTTATPHATITYSGTPPDLVASPFHSMTAYSLDTPSTFGHHHHHHTHHHPHGPYTHSHNTIANPQMTGTQWSHLAAAAHHLNYSPITASPAAQHMAAVAAAATAAAAAAGGNPTVNPASSANGGNPLVNLAPIDVDTASPTPPNEPSMNGNSHATSLIPYDEWMATGGCNLVTGPSMPVTNTSSTSRGSNDTMLISMSPLHSQDSQTIPLSLLTSSSHQHHLQQSHLQPLNQQTEQLSQQEDHLHTNEPSPLMTNLNRYPQTSLSRPMGSHTEYLGTNHLDIGSISTSPESVSTHSHLSDDSLSPVDIHQSQQQQQLSNHHHPHQHLSHSMHIPLNTVSNSYVLNSQRNGSLHVAPQRTNSNDSSLCTDIDSSPSSMMGYTGDNIGRVNRHPFEWMRTPQNNASRTKRIGKLFTYFNFIFVWNREVQYRFV